MMRGSVLVYLYKGRQIEKKSTFFVESGLRVIKVKCKQSYL